MARVVFQGAGVGYGYFEDYNHSGGAQVLPADTWVQLDNDGNGPFTNVAFSPAGATPLVDTATGKIDPTGLALGDEILIRNDFYRDPVGQWRAS